ncbi:MAG: hypothetical protein P1P76_07815 [Anaerolineales bacterium]|nr:hypothetical protein [Anaerolineales bacterium]
MNNRDDTLLLVYSTFSGPQVLRIFHRAACKGYTADVIELSHSICGECLDFHTPVLKAHDNGPVVINPELCFESSCEIYITRLDNGGKASVLALR